MQLLSLPPYLPPSELFQPGSGGEKIILKSCLDFFLKRCICHTALKWVGVLRLKSLSECASDSTALCSIKAPTVDITSGSVCFWCESIPRQGVCRGHITLITTCMMPVNQFNSDHFEHVAKFTVAGMHDYLPSTQHFSAICLTYIFDTLVNFLNLKVLTHISTTSHKWQLYCDLNVLHN